MYMIMLLQNADFCERDFRIGCLQKKMLPSTLVSQYLESHRRAPYPHIPLILYKLMLMLTLPTISKSQACSPFHARLF